VSVADELESVFINYIMAIKIWHAIESGSILKGQIDSDELLTIEEGGYRIPLRQNVLNSQADFILWSQNNIMLAFGAAAITLWESVERNGIITASILNNKKVVTSDTEKIAALTYMLRCCFAHGLTAPKWSMSVKYQISYKVGKKNIDLSGKNRLPFSFDHILGHETFILMRSGLARLGLI